MYPNQHRKIPLVLGIRRAGDINSQALKFIFRLLLNHKIFRNAQEVSNIDIDLGTSRPAHKAKIRNINPCGQR
jgi:hypothetical protein